MEKSDIQAVSTTFFYWWYNMGGTNTEEGFNSWWSTQRQCILLALFDLDLGNGYTKWGLAKETGINEALLKIILKELKIDKKVEIIQFFNEENGKLDGSGYCITSDARKIIKDKN